MHKKDSAKPSEVRHCIKKDSVKAFEVSHGIKSRSGQTLRSCQHDKKTISGAKLGASGAKWGQKIHAVLPPVHSQKSRKYVIYFFGGIGGIKYIYIACEEKIMI